MKDIIGYEELYAITEDGRVWSYPKVSVNSIGRIHKQDGRWLTHSVMGVGYLTVGLSKNRKSKNYTVHRLLATHYLPNPNNYPFVNHKDGNKTNNYIDNLEWCTGKQNSEHAWRTGLIKPSKPTHDSRCHCYKCVPSPSTIKKRLRELKGDYRV